MWVISRPVLESRGTAGHIETIRGVAKGCNPLDVGSIPARDSKRL